MQTVMKKRIEQVSPSYLFQWSLNAQLKCPEYLIINTNTGPGVAFPLIAAHLVRINAFFCQFRL